MGSANDSLGFNIVPRKVTLFLGGTCNGSSWREDLVPNLSASISAFNPVVSEWNEEAKQREFEARQNSDFVLYTITPKLSGVYAIAEVVDDSNKRPEKTLFCFLDNYDGANFTRHQLNSLKEVCAMVERNGGRAFGSLTAVGEFLNNA